jgi:hypothetical protein
VAAALAAVASAAMQASKAMTEYAQYAFVARGSLADKSALAGIAGAANVGLDEAGQLAGSKPGGSKQLLREIDILRNTQGEEMAARYAQAHGIEGFRSVRNMTEGQYQRAMNQPQVSAAGQRVNDRLTTEGNLALKELTVNAQKALIPVILNMTVVFVNLMKVANLMIAPIAAIGEWLADWADKLTGGDHNDAAKKQLKAAEMNMDSANKISDSIHGGGARVRGAIPDKMGSAASWMYNQQYVQRQIRQLGGIN